MIAYFLGILLLLYLYTHGGLPELQLPVFTRPMRDTKMDQTLPGGIVIGLPVPEGWRVYRLADGSQIVIKPGAATAPGGWVQATHNGKWVWFNETTGKLQGAR